MIKKTRFNAIQSSHPSLQLSQPIPVVSVRRETQAERFIRLKRTADVTGRRFVQVYLEDEKRQQKGQR